jgi:beta-phosphoglucomutase-like phosphatase (HAD superfamily)
MITHILFGLNGVLVDRLRLREVLASGYGERLAVRFGGRAADWEGVYRQVVLDWDAYHADLDFMEDGLDAYWEGQLRVLRAMFRVKGAPEPGIDDLKRLARALLGEAASGGDASFPEVRPVIVGLAAQGYTLGVVSLNLTERTRGILAGAGLAECFHGPLIGPDVTEHFTMDAAWYQAAGVEAGRCLVVVDSAAAAGCAQAAGMQAVMPGSPRRGSSSTHLQGDLRAVAAYLEKVR